MARGPKIKIRHAAMPEMRNLPAVQAALTKIGEAIADKATSTASTPAGLEKAKYYADGSMAMGVPPRDPARIHVGIYAGNLAAHISETKHRTLTKAIDAGRKAA